MNKKKYTEDISRDELTRPFLNKRVHIKIDRPLGSVHPKHPSLIYPINYGYIPNTVGGDGEEIDVYLMGVAETVQEYDATVIGIIHRINDIEDKLVAAPDGYAFTKEEIKEAVIFQEQYYEFEIEV